MGDIVLYPISELCIGTDRYKLCLTKGEDSYLFRLCFDDFNDFNILFTCEYNICIDLTQSYEILLTGVRRYAKENKMRSYIPLVVQRDIHTYMGAIICLDTYEIILLSSEKECGKIQKVTSNIKGYCYEDESKCSKRYASL